MQTILPIPFFSYSHLITYAQCLQDSH